MYSYLGSVLYGAATEARAKKPGAQRYLILLVRIFKRSARDANHIRGALLQDLLSASACFMICPYKSMDRSTTTAKKASKSSSIREITR